MANRRAAANVVRHGPVRGLRHAICAAVVIGAACALSFMARAGDFSLDPTSPQVPFTFGEGDVVKQDGTGVSIGAALLGLALGDNVDAVSFGDDQPEPAGLENLVNFDYSVDRTSVGNGGTISTQAAGNGAAGDEFRIIAFKSGRTVGPQRLADAPDRGLTVKSSGTVESDIDALALVAGTQMPVYFSVDRAGSQTLTTAGPADILYVEQPGVTAPVVFATATQLGLAAGDNVDALCVMDRGARGQLDGRDLVYVSLDRTSPTRAGGADAVIRVWPQPAVVIYNRVQLDLAIGDELNAMTARDPGIGGGDGSCCDVENNCAGPGAGLCIPGTFRGPGGIQAFVEGPVRDLLGGFQDTTDDFDIRRRTVTSREGGVRVRNTFLSLVSGQQEGFGFAALPAVGNTTVVATWSTSIPPSSGVVPLSTNGGCELDFDTPPGQFPTRFVYTGCTPLPQGGLRAYANDSGASIGSFQDFPGVDRLEFSCAAGGDIGVDVSCREPGGSWVQLARLPSYASFQTVTCGFGAARCNDGAEVLFSDIEVRGDGPLARYVARFDGTGGLCAEAQAALGSGPGGESDPDIFSASESVDACVFSLQGTPPTSPPKKPATYDDGLIQIVLAGDLGPLPDKVSRKKVSAQLGKALRSALKAQKLLTKSKPSTKGARKQLTRAQSSIATARDLITFGRKVK